PFKWIQQGNQIIRVLADGRDGVIYDATQGQKYALFTKSAGAGKASFLGVGSTCYFTDGVEQKKLVRSYYQWNAMTTYAVGQFLIDLNYNIQVVTAITTGISGASQPIWANTIGALTTDAGVTWTCKGPSIQNWGIAAPTTAPGVANAVLASPTAVWAVSTFFLLDDFLLDSNGNLQFIFTANQTGTITPIWQTAAGAQTTDNTNIWICLGTATRATNHAYYGAVATTLLNPITSTGSQAATPLSLTNIHIGKVLLIDIGTSQEAVVVTAVNSGAGTFTANFTKTHLVTSEVVGPSDTIAVNYSTRYRGIVDYDGTKPIYGFITTYYTDFFQCTVPGT